MSNYEPSGVSHTVMSYCQLTVPQEEGKGEVQ
jgi:hypothetical protein